MNLIVASHGTLCEGLADAFHMLASSEIPITTVSLNDTGVDDFRRRLVAAVEKSKTTAKTLILTDLYGGTPFNESFALYLADPENLRVVAGVNFPMLIEAGMAAPDTDDLDEIVSIAVQAGTAGVVAASAEPDKKDAPGNPKQAEPHANSVPQRGAGKGAGMSIVLARVDDRVIHGQTTTRWMAVKPADAILVISDKVAADELRCKVLKAAAGKYKLGIYTIAQGIEALAKANASAKKFFVISDSVKAFDELKRAGADFGATLNLGNMNATRPGTKDLGRTVLLNDEDLAALDSLESAGVDLQFQLLPDDNIRTWHDMRAKYLAL